MQQKQTCPPAFLIMQFNSMKFPTSDIQALQVHDAKRKQITWPTATKLFGKLLSSAALLTVNETEEDTITGYLMALATYQNQTLY